MHMPRKLLIAGLLAIGLAACARPQAPVVSGVSDLAPRISLTAVPFHPQAERSDCGPAALAMMLGWSGIDTDPRALAPAVYTPGREGTLQSDIIQASRRAGRLALKVRSLRDLLAELDAGNPVLVLQNLGFARFPVWHYAVAMGYDLEDATLFLHSGRKARHAMNFKAFEASWQSSERWALTITRPDRLPATLDLALGLEAAVSYITGAFGAGGADFDNVIVLTTSNSVNDAVLVNDTDTLDFNDSVNDLNGNGLVELPLTDPASVLADLSALDAVVDVILLNADLFPLTDPLLAVDGDGIDFALDTGPYGLPDFIPAPTTIPVGSVVSLSVGGTTIPVADESADPGFQFSLTGIEQDPTLGTVVNVDTDGNALTIEETFDVTGDLMATGPNSFEFDLSLLT